MIFCSSAHRDKRSRSEGPRLVILRCKGWSLVSTCHMWVCEPSKLCTDLHFLVWQGPSGYCSCHQVRVYIDMWESSARFQNNADVEQWYQTVPWSPVEANWMSGWKILGGDSHGYRSFGQSWEKMQKTLQDNQENMSTWKGAATPPPRDPFLGDERAHGPMRTVNQRE